MKLNIYSILTTLHFTIKNGKSITSGIDLLSKTAQNKSEKKVFERINNDIRDGYSFSESLLRQKVGSFDVVNFVKMAEKGKTFQSALEKIIRYIKVKEDFERESNEKISLPVIYFSVAVFVVIAVKFFAVPYQLDKIAGYDVMVKKMVETHLEHAVLMSDALFASLLFVGGYFILLLTALFSDSRMTQFIAKQVTLHLPFTSKIIMKFEKFVLFSMLGEMLESGISFKNVVTSAIQVSNIGKFKKALQNTLRTMKHQGLFILDKNLYDPIEMELLAGVGSSKQIGTIMREISERAKADALMLSIRFFRLITIMSIFLLAFAVFVEFWTVVLTEVLIQKGFIDMQRMGKSVV